MQPSGNASMPMKLRRQSTHGLNYLRSGTGSSEVCVSVGFKLLFSCSRKKNTVCSSFPTIPDNVLEEEHMRGDWDREGSCKVGQCKSDFQP